MFRLRLMGLESMSTFRPGEITGNGRVVPTCPVNGHYCRCIGLQFPNCPRIGRAVVVALVNELVADD